MRDILNLQHLKRSRVEKHNKIYDKAHRMMQEGFETECLTDEQIMEIANRYPRLKVSLQMGGGIIVRSKNDTWYIMDEGRFITLYHKSYYIQKGRTKERYHVQDVFYDLDFVFASIISHDDFVLGIQIRDIDGIKEIVAQSFEQQSALQLT